MVKKSSSQAAVLFGGSDAQASVISYTGEEPNPNLHTFVEH